mgnify:CR=1 FL=1
MSHFAKLDENNVVTFVTVGRQEDDGLEAELCERTGDVYKQTSYNTYGGIHYTTDDDGNRVSSDDQTKALRFNYAGIGFTFDPDKGTDGAFIPPKPFDSWVLNEDTCRWVSPVAMPEIEYDENGEPVQDYVWDEEAGAWVAATEDAVE